MPTINPSSVKKTRKQVTSEQTRTQIDKDQEKFQSISPDQLVNNQRYLHFLGEILNLNIKLISYQYAVRLVAIPELGDKNGIPITLMVTDGKLMALHPFTHQPIIINDGKDLLSTCLALKEYYSTQPEIDSNLVELHTKVVESSIEKAQSYKDFYEKIEALFKSSNQEEFNKLKKSLLENLNSFPIYEPIFHDGQQILKSSDIVSSEEIIKSHLPCYIENLPKEHAQIDYNVWSSGFVEIKLAMQLQGLDIELIEINLAKNQAQYTISHPNPNHSTLTLSLIKDTFTFKDNHETEITVYPENCLYAASIAASYIYETIEENEKEDKKDDLQTGTINSYKIQELKKQVIEKLDSDVIRQSLVQQLQVVLDATDLKTFQKELQLLPMKMRNDITRFSKFSHTASESLVKYAQQYGFALLQDLNPELIFPPKNVVSTKRLFSQIRQDLNIPVLNEA